MAIGRSYRHGSEGQLPIYLIIGIVLGVIGFFQGFKLRKKKRLIENIPTSTVRGMAVGLVEVKGFSQPVKGTLKTPFAKADSVFYHYKVQELRSTGRSSTWVTIKEFRSPDPFYLKDETGEVLIDPAGAELYLQADRKFQLGGWGGGGDCRLKSPQSQSEIFEQRLRELGIDPKGFLGFRKQLRCVETYLCPGDTVYIMGAAAKNPAITMSATGSENLCIQKGSAPFFCIADKSEKELLGSMNKRMYLFLYGGPVLTVVCLFIMIISYFQKLL